MVPLRSPLTFALAFAAFAPSATAQTAADGPVAGVAVRPDSLSNRGVVRAAHMVDSVFLDKLKPEGTISGGDWASYLMARLGITPIPASMRIGVTVDTQRVVLKGKVGDLPPEAKLALGPIVNMLGPESVYLADIRLGIAGPTAVRFHLESVTVNGIFVPEPMLQTVMLQVGKQYPALSRTGRDLLVEVPPGGRIKLIPNGVRLTLTSDSTGGHGGAQ